MVKWIICIGSIWLWGCGTNEHPAPPTNKIDTEHITINTTEPDKATPAPANNPSIVISDTALGDLNKDGLVDSVVVTQDTAHDKGPYTLRIFFAKPDRSYQLVLGSDSAILPMYSEGKNGWRDGIDFEEVAIKKGVLIISTELLRGRFENLFRYQNGRFEMIGYDYTESDGHGTITSSQYNLSTGRYVTIDESYETNKQLSKLDTIIPIRPLPDLRTFVPLSTAGSKYINF